MERFLTRQAIRQRLRIITGQSQSESLSGQTYDRHNQYISLANDEVLLRRQWAATRRSLELTLEIDQQLVNYPANCRGENVEEFGVWSNGTDATSGYYVPLKKQRIPLALDTEPITAAGGDPAAAVRGFPTRWEPKTQIEIWKRPDKQYLAKLDYTVSPALEQDTDESVVDAVIIVHLAAELEFDFLGDEALAAKQRRMAEQRLALLHAWQHAGETFAADRDCTFDDDAGPTTYYNISTDRPG